MNLKIFLNENLLQVWPFLFSHYSFESTKDERIEIDQTTNDRYQALTNEWHNAEEIVIKIDLQRANRRKNSPIVVKSNPTSNQSALSTFKNVLAKISLPTFDTRERKQSNTSNDVFFEVHSIDEHFIFL